MAYQTRQRDPLFDSNMQAMIEKRGTEAGGLVLLLAGLSLGAMLWTYSPQDPGWMAATDAVPRNVFGHVGASVSALMVLILGLGGYGLALGALIWGLRLMAHKGTERAAARLVFFPIAVALGAIYAATYAPPANWPSTFGPGGLFGDTVLGALLNVLPIAPEYGLRAVAMVSFFAGLALGAYVLGLTGAEVRQAGRFLAFGLLASGAAVMGLLRLGGRGAGAAARLARDRAQARATARREARDEARRREPTDPVDDVRGYAGATAAAATGPSGGRPADGPAYASVDPPASRSGVRTLFDRVPLIGARAAAAVPAPEYVRAELDADVPVDAPDNDRVRRKISEVIRNRVRPPLRADTGVATERPSVISAAVARRAAAGIRAEPPLRAPADAGSEVPAPNAAAPAGRDAPAGSEAAPATCDDRPARTAPAAASGDAPPAAAEAARRVVQPAARKAPAPSRRARAEAQPSLQFEDESLAYVAPPLSLLTDPASVQRHHLSDEALEQNARMLESVLDDYGVKGEIVSVRPGPVVTMYELEPAPGLKASRVIGLADDIARSMSALSARVSTVPGRTVIGIELPNQNREMVVLREILSQREFGDGTAKLPLALGKEIGGDPIVANLSKMPHLLIAGTTGSGKSVAINTMILSLLYKLSPDECRLIMIDPKMLELSVYDGIPHLLSPVVTDPKKAVVALKWVVGEMEERYRKMSRMGVRNIEGYNGRVDDAQERGEMFSRTYQTGFDDETGEPVFETEEYDPVKLPYIVVVVDEMADLMMVAGKEIEACIQRLAQMARASGIHIIMATQRPSVDVITGTIKANFPTRISFHVTSKVDSRTILGEQGAEQLLGMGDMLYMAGGARITRIHGPFVRDEEIEEIVNHLKSFGPPSYQSGVVDGPEGDKEGDIDAVLGLGGSGSSGGEDELYDKAVNIVINDRKCSTSYIQRKLGIGYNKAARLVEQMEDEGVVSGANHVGKREVLVPEPG